MSYLKVADFFNNYFKIYKFTSRTHDKQLKLLPALISGYVIKNRQSFQHIENAILVTFDLKAKFLTLELARSST